MTKSEREAYEAGRQWYLRDAAYRRGQVDAMAEWADRGRRKGARCPDGLHQWEEPLDVWDGSHGLGRRCGRCGQEE